MLYEGILKKTEKGLTHANSRTKALFEQFKSGVPEGSTVHVYMELEDDDGTLGQLAKVHKLIRILAHHTGNSFEDMKLLVKDRAGLCIVREIEGKEYFTCKSFGKCSNEELSTAIQTAIELGQKVNLNLS